jgi:hypothetical protein
MIKEQKEDLKTRLVTRETELWRVKNWIEKWGNKRQACKTKEKEMRNADRESISWEGEV